VQRSVRSNGLSGSRPGLDFDFDWGTNDLVATVDDRSIDVGGKFVMHEARTRMYVPEAMDLQTDQLDGLAQVGAAAMLPA